MTIYYKGYVLCVLVLHVFRQGSQTSIKQSLTLFTSLRTWNDAQQVCQDNGMSLVKMESATKVKAVNEFITEWEGETNITKEIWIGLHKVDDFNMRYLQWTDCDTNNTQLSIDEMYLQDDKMCFSIDNGSNLTSKICSVQLMFICQKNVDRLINPDANNTDGGSSSGRHLPRNNVLDLYLPLGICDFDTFYENTGCGVDLKQTQELSLHDCLNTCRNGVMTTGEECWSVGFWPNFSGDDCWMFYSKDPSACENDNFQNSFITMYMKTCYEGMTNSTYHAGIENSNDFPVSLCSSQQTTTEESSTLYTTELTHQYSSTDMGPSITPGDQNGVTTPEGGQTYESSSSSQNGQQSTPNPHTLPPGHSSTTINHSEFCLCDCHFSKQTLSLEDKIAEMKELLTIDKRKTSNFIRKLTSADDSRTSAMYLGVCGVVCIIACLFLIILMDVPLYITYLKRLSIFFK